jgi:PAS domain S-box-containing protein
MSSTPLLTVESSNGHYRRLYRLLSELTDAVFSHADDFAAICTHACRVAVESGGYRYAFIGLLDAHSPFITPTYLYGDHGGYLDRLRLSVDSDHPEGRGPTGIAARTLIPFIVNDVSSDPVMARWRSEATRVGVQATAAFPLIHGNRNLFGVLNLYSGEANRFDAEEIELLSRVAQQISVAYGRHLEEEKRHIADADRRHAQINLANIVDMAGDAIITVDEEKQIRLFNRAAEEIFGWRHEEVIGKSLDMLIPPELVEAHDEQLRQFTGRSNQGKGRVHRREVQAVRKDGSRFPASNTFSMVRSNGKWMYIATLRDITASKAAEASLLQVHSMVERAAKEWRVTFDAVVSPIIILDREKRIRRLNQAACQRLGQTPADIIGEPFCGDHLADVACADLLNAIDSVLETGEIKQVSLTLPNTQRHWHITISPWGHDAQGANAVVVVGDDVTELLRLQQSVRESESMAELGQLVAGVSHEVRNPLFGMSATLDAFELKHGTDPTFSRYLTALRRELTRMSDLVRDLLDYGKPLDLKFEPVDLNSIFREAGEITTGLLQDKQVRLVLNVPQKLPDVRADVKRLVMVVVNLISNAIHYAPTETTVRIAVHETNDGERSWLWCAVKDEGPGFNPQDLVRVFQPFYTRRKGGTGLGLSIVERIISKHGGVVRASNHPHGGAEVMFGLPIL